MGTWSGFVAKVVPGKFDDAVEVITKKYKAEIKLYKELGLIIGIIECNDLEGFAGSFRDHFESIRGLGQIGNRDADYPSFAYYDFYEDL